MDVQIPPLREVEPSSMSLPLSPLGRFSQVEILEARVHLRLRIPWQLPWIKPLRGFLAWQLVAACEMAEQIAPRKTKDWLDRYAASADDVTILDGDFAANADTFLNTTAHELARVYPRPAISICCPNDSISESLDEFAQLLDISLSLRGLAGIENSSTDTQAAVRLLGSVGILDDVFGNFLTDAAYRARDL